MGFLRSGWVSSGILWTTGFPAQAEKPAKAGAVSVSGGRHIPGGLFRALAEKESLHLAREILPGALVGEIQPVFVDQHRLMLEPELPGFLADVVVNAFPQF